MVDKWIEEQHLRGWFLVEWLARGGKRPVGLQHYTRLVRQIHSMFQPVESLGIEKCWKKVFKFQSS